MNDYQFVDGTRLSSVIESIIFASPEPISADQVCSIIEQGEEQLQLESKAIDRFVEKLNQRYEENGLAFGIEAVAGGYTFSTRKRYAPWLSIIQHADAYRKLSQSAIETLAIVAYRQPITKPEVDSVRGVDSGYILRQLLEKVLIEVAGRLDAPGKPLIYRTSKHFLAHFGINSIDELPRPREIEEILKDDDMADHRQFLFDRQLELEDMQDREEDSPVDISVIEAVEALKGEDRDPETDQDDENGQDQKGEQEADQDSEEEQERAEDLSGRGDETGSGSDAGGTDFSSDERGGDEGHSEGNEEHATEEAAEGDLDESGAAEGAPAPEPNGSGPSDHRKSKNRSSENGS